MKKQLSLPLYFINSPLEEQDDNYTHFIFIVYILPASLCPSFYKVALKERL